MAIRFGQDESFHAWSRKISEMMDQMLRRNFVDFRRTDTWKPATNVYESRDAFNICVELAGMDRAAIDVQGVEPNQIRVSGRRAKPVPDHTPPLQFVVHAMEIDEGVFWRDYHLALPIELSAIDARYDKGYLWITAPKKKTHP